MGTALGTTSKAAFRVESDNGLVGGTYPISEATADTEEVLLKGSDLLPLISESISEERTYERDETIAGLAGAPGIDLVSILGGGSLELKGMYDGLDALIFCAMGFEDPDVATGSPVAQSATDLTSSGSTAAGTWDDTGTPFTDAATDVGKFIKEDDAGDAASGQVRRISGFTDTNTVSVTGNWATTPGNGDTGVMALEWKHTYELARNMEDELWTVEDSTYPTTGVGTATDRIFRRGTLGILKQSTTPWIFRSCMVNSMTISMQAGQSARFTFELIPFNLDRASATNGAASAANWDWDHESALFDQNEVMMFSDISYFYLHIFSTSDSLEDTTLDHDGTDSSTTWKDAASVFVSTDVGKTITITAGTGIGQARRITTYNSATNVTVSPAWATSPGEDSMATLAPRRAISAFELTLNNNLKVDDMDVNSGQWRVQPCRAGQREITGSFTLPRYEYDTMIDWQAADTVLMGELKITGSTMTNVARYMKIYLCSLKLEGAAMPVAGPGVTQQTYNFRCLIPTGAPSGFPTPIITTPRSEMMIQTLNFNPFNQGKDEQREY